MPLPICNTSKRKALESLPRPSPIGLSQSIEVRIQPWFLKVKMLASLQIISPRLLVSLIEYLSTIKEWNEWQRQCPKSCALWIMAVHGAMVSSLFAGCHQVETCPQVVACAPFVAGTASRPMSICADTPAPRTEANRSISPTGFSCQRPWCSSSLHPE